MINTLNIKPVAPDVQDNEEIQNRENAINYRDIYPSTLKFNKHPKLPGNMTKLPFNYEQILNKPIYLGSTSWDTTAVAGSRIGDYSIPKSIIEASSILAIPWNSSCLYRMSGRLVFQVSGTINHAGVLIASCHPYNMDVLNVNNELVLPHAFLYANQASAVSVEMPFFSNTPLRQTNNGNTCRLNQYNDQYDSYAFVSLEVLNALRAGSGSTTVQVSTHVIIDMLEFYTPKVITPVYALADEMSLQSVSGVFDGIASILKKGSADAIDIARNSLRSLTGLHNPNLPGPIDKHYMQQRTNPNLVDSVTQYDLLAPYALNHSQTDDYYFKNDSDEMDLGYLVRHNQYIGTAVVDSTTAASTLLFTRPITPFMTSTVSSHRLYTSLSRLSACASFWSGDLELKIQGCMTGLQFAKLLVVLDYSKNINDTNLGSSNFPNPDAFRGVMSHVVEFAGGGTIQCIRLPFMSYLRQLPVTTDWRANALQHGIVRVYLLQSIVTGSPTATSIDFNFYVSACENFRLHGFALRKFNTTGVQPTLAATSDEDFMTVQSEFSAVPVVTDQSCLDMPKQEKKDEENPYFAGALRPIYNIRDMVRRMYPTTALTITAAEMAALTTQTVTRYISVENLFRSYSATTAQNNYTPQDVISDMFYGFRGGLKFKLVTYGSNSVTVQYLPPCYTVGTSNVSSTVKAIQKTGPITTNTVITNNLDITTNQYANGISRLQIPLQESANYARRAETKFVPTSGSVYQADSVVINDVEIPYMSPFDFTTNLSTYSVSATTQFSSEEDLGYLVVNYTPLSVTSTGTVASYSPINTIIYVGLADDARYGIFIGGRPTNPSFNNNSGSPIQNDPFFNNGPGIGATNVTVPLQISDAGAGPAYYTKTT
jgi:hypothetical protein